MFSFFKKKKKPISLEQQLIEVGHFGVKLNTGVTVDDLFIFQPREVHEAAPYKELFPVLGCDIERAPYTPICNQFWMCDYERIEDHGSYTEVIIRLQRMTSSALPITNLSDYVDVEGGIAWVEFNLAESRIHWDAQVDNDWLDPHIIVKFDELLRTYNTQLRIFSNHADFGQSALFCCFTTTDFEQIKKLVPFSLSTIT